MSASQGSIETQEAIGHFAEALRQRIGADRYRLWFTHGVRFEIAGTASAVDEASGRVGEKTEATDNASDARRHDDAEAVASAGCDRQIRIVMTGPFAAARIGKNFASEMRAAAIAALGDGAGYRIEVDSVEEVRGAELQESDLAERTAITQSAAESRRMVSSPRREAAAGVMSGGRRRVGRGTGGQDHRQFCSRGSAQALSGLLAGGVASHRSSETRGAETRVPNTEGPVTRVAQTQGDAERVGPATAGRNGSQRNGVAARDRRVVDSRNDAERSKSDAGSGGPAAPAFLPDSEPIGHRTLDSFLSGPCNEFAVSAAMMAITTPEVATPLFLHGPTGTGKSHLLAGLADAYRRRRRMRRVILLTAEQFTNDFVNSVNTTGLPGFRRKYREVDALLIDDVHFLASKPATLREALYTVETLAAAGKPLVFTANLPPSDIRGLTGEIAGRMTSGLVCPLTEIDAATRLQLLRRATSMRCLLGCDDGLLREVAELLPGDARAIHGVANLVGMLQRMFRREPTIEEIRRYGGDLLRGHRAAPTLRTIERAVCEAFGLEGDGLRSKAQTRRVSEPRTLAMYLSRQLTGSAFTEIAKHFGRRSHSGAIAAQQKVETWLASNKQIGGGESALTAQDAIAKIEARLRTCG